ncbi:unnamed protein product [Closterium sp. NIES-64]|nr:unnamed protein product [Closterium sp. NIES-64]
MVRRPGFIAGGHPITAAAFTSLGHLSSSLRPASISQSLHATFPGRGRTLAGSAAAPGGPSIAAAGAAAGAGGTMRATGAGEGTVAVSVIASHDAPNYPLPNAAAASASAAAAAAALGRCVGVLWGDGVWQLEALRVRAGEGTASHPQQNEQLLSDPHHMHGTADGAGRSNDGARATSVRQFVRHGL